MPKVIANTLNMDRAKWLEIRSNYIGGSDAGIILGVNKYKTAFELWLEKTKQIEPEEINNEAIEWGNILEDEVAKAFERKTGKKVRRKNQMLQHDEHPFMMANLDRVIVGENAFLECKTASAYLLKEWEGDEIPASYLAQVNHYMAVGGYEKAYIAVLIGGQKFIWKEIQRDDELIKFIIDAEYDFWHGYVLAKAAPPLDGSSAAEQYVKNRFPSSTKHKAIGLAAAHKDNIEKYLFLKEQIAELTGQQKQVENLIKMDLQDAESGTVNNFIVNWKSVVSNRVDSKALKVDYPEIYEKVTKESHSRRFEIKEAKE